MVGQFLGNIKRQFLMKLPLKKSAGYGGLLFRGSKSLLPVYLVNDFFKLQVIVQINNLLKIRSIWTQ